MTLSMVQIKSQLPPHCVIKKRKGYEDIYFHVHPKDRPDDWPASIKIGKSDEDPSKLIQKANEIYEEYKEFRANKAAGYVLREKRGSISDVAKIYQQSHEFQKLGDRTKKDYGGFISDLVAKSKKVGDPHISQMTTKHIVQWINTYQHSPNRQRCAKVVMSLLFTTAVKEGYVDRNPVREIRLSYKKVKKQPVVIWEQEDLKKFITHADRRGYPSLALAAMIGYETGQRPQDLYSIQRPKHYKDGQFIFLQKKTGKEVRIPASKKLACRIDSIPKEQLMICSREDGKLWKEDYAAKVVRKLCNEIGLPNHQMKFFRHTLVRDSERANISDNDLCTITGHSRETIKRMKDAHYGIDRDEIIAQKTVKNLSKYRQSQTKSIK